MKKKYTSTLLAAAALSGVAFTACSSSSSSAESPESFGQVTGKLRVDAPGGTIGVTTSVDFQLECDGDVLKSGSIPVPLDGSSISGHFGSVPPSNDCEITLSTTLTLSADPFSVACQGSSGLFDVPANTDLNIGDILIACSVDNSSSVDFTGTVELVDQSLDTFFVGPTTVPFDPSLPAPVTLSIEAPAPGVDYTWDVDPASGGTFLGCDIDPDDCEFFCAEAGTHTLTLTASFGTNSRSRDVEVTCVDTIGSITVIETVTAGSTVTSDNGSASVTVPADSTVTIAESTTTEADPPGFSFLDQQYVITVDPPGTVADPLILTFSINTSDTNVAVFKNGVEIDDCVDSTPGASADPDPCVESRVGSSPVVVTVRTSTASFWNFGVVADPGGDDDGDDDVGDDDVGDDDADDDVGDDDVGDDDTGDDDVGGDDDTEPGVVAACNECLDTEIPLLTGGLELNQECTAHAPCAAVRDCVVVSDCFQLGISPSVCYCGPDVDINDCMAPAFVPQGACKDEIIAASAFDGIPLDNASVVGVMAADGTSSGQAFSILIPASQLGVCVDECRLIP